MRKIEIDVRGGLIEQIEGIPDDVCVIVRDYDCMEMDDDGNENPACSEWTKDGGEVIVQ